MYFGFLSYYINIENAVDNAKTFRRLVLRSSSFGRHNDTHIKNSSRHGNLKF